MTAPHHLAQLYLWVQFSSNKSPETDKDSAYLKSFLGGAMKSTQGLKSLCEDPGGRADKAGKGLVGRRKHTAPLLPSSSAGNCEETEGARSMWSRGVIWVTPGHGRLTYWGAGLGKGARRDAPRNWKPRGAESNLRKHGRRLVKAAISNLAFGVPAGKLLQCPSFRVLLVNSHSC